MKMAFSRQRNGAMTAFEVLVVIVCVLIAAVILFQILIIPPHSGGQRTFCVSNLRQVNIAFQIWAGDNNNRYPMAVSVTHGGAMELMDAGNLTACLQFATNEMCTTKIFVCPADSARTFATNWYDLNRLHVSYFLSADASDNTNSKMIFGGDDNVAIGGTPVVSGLVNVSSNAPVSWFGTRHGTVYRPHFWSFPKTNGCGNLIFADGSAERDSSIGLQRVFLNTGLATNRIVIP